MQPEGVQGAARNLRFLLCSHQHLAPFGGARGITSTGLGQTGHVARLLVTNIDGDRIDFRQLPEPLHKDRRHANGRAAFFLRTADGVEQSLL